MLLPMMAYTSLLNDRAAVPPAYIPAYGAISFLPWSLKPIYAVLSSWLVGSSTNSITDGQQSRRRNRLRILLTVLLAVNGFVQIGSDMFIPQNGVVACFLWGFARGVAGAWPQFLLGLALIETSHLCSKADEQLSYEDVASVFQAQASTMRNIGSLLASISTSLLFPIRKHFHLEQMNSHVVSMLLCGTALLYLVGSVIAGFNLCSGSAAGRIYQAIEATDGAEDNTTVESEEEGEDIARNDDEHADDSWSHAMDIAALGSFQAILVLTALKAPIQSVTSHSFWVTTTALLGFTLLVSVVASSMRSVEPAETKVPMTAPPTNRIPGKRLALFLLFRQSVPTSGSLVSSFFYTQFSREHPLFLQVLSMLNTASSTLATWTYGKCFSQRHGRKLVVLMAILTIVQVAAAFLEMISIRAARRGAISTIIILSIVSSFTGELAFMPLTILATTNSVSTKQQAIQERQGLPSRESSQEIEMTTVTESRWNGSVSSRFSQQTTFYDTADEGVQYATYLSSMNFGVQLGEWLSVPILLMLHVERENSWANLEKFVLVCAGCRLMSILLLTMILPPKAQQTMGGVPAIDANGSYQDFV